MEEESENFCLRWDTFEQNIIGAFKDLRKEKDFYDVTLVCEEKQVQAHRVVLAMCSPTFRDMISHSPHHHPVLYMRGIRHTDLLAMLDFMYHGQVMIATEELETFLATAQDLSVRGLVQSGDDTEREPANAEEALNDDVENLLRRLEGGEPPEKVRKINVKKEPGASSEISLPASITKVRIKQEPSSKTSKPTAPTPLQNSVVLERVEEPAQPNYNNFQPSSGAAQPQPPSTQNYPGLNISTVTEQPPQTRPGLNISTVTEQPQPTPELSKQSYPRLDISAAKTMAATGHAYPGINLSTTVEKQVQLPSQSLNVSQQPGPNYVNNSTPTNSFRRSNTPTAAPQNYTLNTAPAANFHVQNSSMIQHPKNVAIAVSGSSVPNLNPANMTSSRALAYLRTTPQMSPNVSSASTPVSYSAQIKQPNPNPATYSAQTKQPNSNPVLEALTATSSATLAASIAALGGSNPSQQPPSHIATRGRTSMDDIMAKAIDIAQLGTFTLGNSAMAAAPAPAAMMSQTLLGARTALAAQSGSRIAQKPPTEMFNPRPTYTLAYDPSAGLTSRPTLENDSQGTESEGQTDPESYLEKVPTPEGQGQLLRCRVCQKMGNSKGKAQLIAHVESVHLKSSVQCNVCNKHFKAKSYLNKHLKRGTCCNAVINSISGVFPH